MSDHFLRDARGRCHTIVSVANVYRYNGFTFEFHPFFGGPCKITKNGDPAARQGLKFFRAVDKWNELTDEQKTATQIAG